MRERARSLDGELLVESAPGAGTVLRVSLPMPESAAAHPHSGGPMEHQ